MPVVKQPLDRSPAPVPAAIQRIEDVEARSTIVDTRYTPLSSLMTFVEGSTYTVDYYSQVLNQDTALFSQDPGQSPLYHQFKKINRLEIKLDSPLSGSQDEESKRFTIKGSGLIHSFVIPNHGDMFTADVGDGREGVFQVEISEKKSIFKESVYAIDFTLVYFVDADPDRKHKDLDAKVVQELHYVRDFIRQGQNPLISTSGLNALQELEYYYAHFVKEYFRLFFSNEFSTLLIPGQQHSIYDSYITNVIKSILSINEHHKIVKLRIPSVADDDMLPLTNIWTAMLERNPMLLKTAIRKTGLVYVKSFNTDPMLRGLRFAGFEYVVYPKTTKRPIDTGFNHQRRMLSPVDIANVPTEAGDNQELIPNGKLDDQNHPIYFIHNVLKDDYYVLSQAFYEDKSGKSVLEVMCSNYLERKSNDPVELVKLCATYNQWGGLEKFYYIPLLLILIKGTIKDM